MYRIVYLCAYLTTACTDDSVLVPIGGDAGPATFACCLMTAGRPDPRSEAPVCDNGGWTCYDGWVTCAP